jgi:two-component system, OmpR family, phosphate regulon sensor histidine kinase PhoR
VVNGQELRLAAERGRMLVEESREIVLVLDAEDCVVAASRRAREWLPALAIGHAVPAELLTDEAGVVVPYDVDGSTERLVYFGTRGALAAYEELRVGFTAAVSHELRTPLARLLALIESIELPGSEPRELAARARSEVEQIAELIDEVLFLSELETGREVVALGSSRVREVLDEVAASLSERAVRAGMEIRVEGPVELEVPLRARMLRVIVENLAENALRYAGPGATLTLAIALDDEHVLLSAVDTGAGVSPDDLPRLFERFYRADRARASRGTGLGLAIVKHIVTAAGGVVQARIPSGGGLEIRCVFPAA